MFTLSSSSFYAGRGGALYVSSKFALRGAVVQLAREVAPDVRVNGVAPGGTVGTDLRGPRSLGLDDHRLDDRPGRAEQLARSARPCTSPSPPPTTPPATCSSCRIRPGA